MKKKSTPQSAFFNLRVLIGLCIALAGISLALVGFDAFAANRASNAQAKQEPKIINVPGLPPGFDCSTIYEKGIDRMENFRAGLLMIACGESSGGEAEEGLASARNPLAKLARELLPVPLAFGAADVDVVTGTETFPSVTQSETYTTANPDNPNQIVVNYNDSKAAPGCYAGLSYSSDGGMTFTRLNPCPLCSGHGTNFGDPIVVYNKPTSSFIAMDLATGCGGQGIGTWKSTDGGATWSASSCAHNGSFDDRESAYADNNTSSPFFGRMYVSWNDFTVGCGAGGCLFVTYSSDNGLTWHSPIQLTPTGSAFIRDIQVTADKVTGDVYVAGMDEGGGGFPHNDTNKIFRSTDGGATWTNTYTGSPFPGPGVTAVGYFACMFPDGGGYWRHEGWGEPAAYNHVVSLVYSQHGTGADSGDVYYIRSTDSGVTFGAPFKLNSDATTRPQWQVNLSVSDAGTLFATWYDARESATCTKGNPAVPCYRMFSRKSNDNGATWLPDDTLSDVVSPLPGQPDGNVQGTYAGDYDYGTALLTKHLTSWTDGRVTISGQSQQDAFTDRELVGFAVTTTTPACNSVINTQPVDFVVNLSDPALPSSVQASDFTVNGTPANSFTYSGPPSTQITFHFTNTPVTTQGPQTMHIAAGAILRNSDSAPIFEFNCTFCYAITPLMVTTTNPPVGGTFTPPAPGNYNYDVNFNQPVDPASVQDSDLTVSGNSGPSVTGHSVSGSTVTFTLHMNFGGTLTASIGAGSITANSCNGNAAFTGNYTVDGCPPQNHYAIAQIGGSIVAGTTDTGNHGDDQTTTVALPFSYTLYDQTFNSITVSSNGNAQFTTTDAAFTNVCPLPWAAHNYTIFPYWDDQRTDAQSGCASFPGGTCGIFTSVSGTAPNRSFNIEWRTVYFADVTMRANYELRLYEGQSHFDVVWGAVALGNTSATGGVQKSTDFDQYFCNGSGGATTGGQSYILQTCGSPTPTPTASPSATPTAPATATPTATPTAPATATPTAPATATPTATATPACTPNYVVTSGSGTIVPGTSDTGNHADDGTTTITLPFTAHFYDQSFTSAIVGSNGTLGFTANGNAFTNSCLPAAAENNAILPHWDDLETVANLPGCSAYPGGACGIFTTVEGTAPNRILDIEYRAVFFGNTSNRANFEIRLFEADNHFEVVYGEVAGAGASATVGAQRDTGSQFTQFECNTGGLTSGLNLTFTQPPCGTPTPTPTPTATPSCTPGWSAGAPMPTPAVRSAGVYFPANGKFYGMGGRSADTAGSDFTHPFEYDPAANTWTTKGATYADSQVNNMACGVLTDAGTPYIYCVGGSAAGQAAATDRVFRYNPVTDVISPVASPWPGAMGTILPGGFSVFNNKLYILGGFNNPVGMVDTIYEFTPNPAGWVLKNAHLPAARGYIPTTTIGNFIYTGGGSMFDPTVILVDTTDSFRYDPVADSIITIASIPRATAETRALNVNGQMWVMGGGRTAPNPSNEVDIYNPGTNSWSIGTPFVTARRNFPTDTDGCHIWLAGGYAPTTPTDSMEIFCCGGGPSPTPTATATPTASPTCTPSSFHVLIAYSDIGGPPGTLQSQILAEPGVTGVDLFDASSGTPTLAQLQPYNIVVAFSNNPYADPVAMGNVLADYADTGGVVVGLNFDWFGAPFGLDGRWITGGYTPFNTGPTNFSTSCLGTYDTTHPLMQGISAGSLCAFFRHTLTLSPGAVSVAMYQDSQQLCAYKTNNGHTGVGINAYLGENPMNFSGPFGHVIVNAGRWLVSGPCGTPSPTPTASPTATFTPTVTPTATATATFTPTATATATPTFTPTATATATFTPTATATATSTATATATATVPPRPTPTPRPRPTPPPRP